MKNIIFINLFFCFIFSPLMSEAQESSPPLEVHTKTSSLSKEFYNQGVFFLKSKDNIQAIASFRKSLELDSWNWKAQQRLKNLESPLPFWWLIPYEVFLFSIALALFSFLFSFRIWKMIALVSTLIFTFSFWYYRSLPRWTVIQTVSVLSAPVKKSPTLFTLSPSSFVTEIGEHNNEWVQIKTQEGSGWLRRSSLWGK